LEEDLSKSSNTIWKVHERAKVFNIMK